MDQIKIQMRYMLRLEKFILKIVNESKDRIIGYKELQDAVNDKFEGVRLILKNLKVKGYVTFDGVMPALNAVIELLKNP